MIFQMNQREAKARKVSKQASSVSADCCGEMAAPIKTHGIGKGLMTVWQATNPDAGNFPAGTIFGGRKFMDVSPVSTSSSEHSLRQGKRPPRQAKVKGRVGSKVQGKRKPLIKTRRVECNEEKSQKQLCYEKCELAWEGIKSQECIDQFAVLVDDEELELRELQARKHIITSCDHFMTNGVNSCSLCKDMLGKFPPNSVKMKQPFGMQPWDSSRDIGKKLFKVFNFLCTYAITLGVCSFTLDEFAESFHDKDSFLLGKVHVALLKLLFCDIEAELSNAYLTPLSKSCKFLALVHSLGSKDFALEVWKKSLNPLTWTEILRQVLVAAGFCSKQDALQKETLSKSIMPEGAMIGAWTKSAHKLWIKRLRRTSSLAELMQVVADFVGAINEDWFCNLPEDPSVRILDTLASFASLPQTTSALAFWLVKLDAFLYCYVWKDLKSC